MVMQPHGMAQSRIFIIRSPLSRDHYSISFFNRLQIFMARETLIFPFPSENFTENFNTTFGRLVWAVVKHLIRTGTFYVNTQI